VQQFFKVFVDIVLWRRGPQDLPSSMLLIAATLIAYVLVSALSLSLSQSSQPRYFVFLVIEPIMLMGWIWIVLKVYRREERYRQTIAAILGASALIGLVLLLPLQLLLGLGAAQPPTEAELVLALGFAFIQILVAGHIIQLAIDSNLFTGACVMAIYVFVDIIAAGLVTGG
jgi:hypothetical protein